MRKIEKVEELREIQMSIMDQIHTFCVKNDLDYTISCGTLLGAIRHKGYIPWDDDIDINMPRKSYDIFVETFNKQSGHYELVNHKNRKRYTQTYAKVIDTDTIAEEAGNLAKDMGIWVDVFPMDGVPSNRFMRFALYKVKRFFSMLIQCGKVKGNSPIIKYLFCRYFPLSENAKFKIFEWIITRWPNSDMICNLSTGGPLKDKSFPRECISHYELVKYEDREWYAMAGWHDYLTCTYGNYKELPPVEKRVHHDFVAFYK